MSRRDGGNGGATFRLGNFHRPFRTNFLFHHDQTLRVWLISGCPCGTKRPHRTQACFGVLRFCVGMSQAIKRMSVIGKQLVKSKSVKYCKNKLLPGTIVSAPTESSE